MNSRCRLSPLWLALAALAWSGQILPTRMQPTPILWAEEPISYGRDVRPILSNFCFRCHGPDEENRQADLRLDLREAAIGQDSDDRRPIWPGRSSESLVIERILSEDESLRMPPVDSGLVLTPSQIQTLSHWIDQGATYEGHWSFALIENPPGPELVDPWMENGLDLFVLDKLRSLQIQPSPRAAKSTLIRRVYLDLLGVLPTQESIDDYVDDDTLDAYVRMVDRALASPRYGERWGRHWLDQARYADSNGYTVDTDRSIWPYRDWVLQAINQDMPFDRFSIEQLAGDLLEDPTVHQQVATGFHRNTLVNQEGGTDPEQFRNEAMVDRVNTTGAVWLGLTLGCAQCHNHKYDPISQREYYQLFAFFNSGRDVNSIEPTLQLPSPEQTQQLAKLDDEIASIKAEIEMPRAEGQPTETAEGQDTPVDEKKMQLAQLEKKRKEWVAAIPTTMVMKDLEQPRSSTIHVRGDFLRHGEPVVPATPHALPPMKTSSGIANRLDLAKWLFDPSHPLTARVIVNRTWTHFFALGLVETENDFGLQGTPPTHPELLDWLSNELIKNDWSIKWLHRTIVLSSTYQQSSSARPELESIDPRSRWLARQQRLRVDSEIVRDLALCASGLLSSHIGGPSVYPPQQDGVYRFTQNQAAWPTSRGDDRYRRTMYTFFRRSAPYPLLTTFDTPRLDTTCTRRIRSNTPLQSLALANDPAILELAEEFGKRIASTSSNDADRVRWAFGRCMIRPPSLFEQERLTSYVAQLRSEGGDEVKIWSSVARLLFNLDEFITRE